MTTTISARAGPLTTQTTTSLPSTPPRRFPKAKIAFHHREGVRQALRRLAHHAVRRSLERLRRRAALRRPEAGQEVHGPQDGGRPDLEGHPGPHARPRATGGPRRAEEGQGDQGATAKDAAPTAREGSKKAIVLELIRRADGASLKKSWRRLRGRPIASAASSPAAWARRWASPSNPSNAPMAPAPTDWRSSTTHHTAAGLTTRRRFSSSLPSRRRAVPVTSCFTQETLRLTHIRSVDPRDDAVLQLGQFLAHLGQQRPVLQARRKRRSTRRSSRLPESGY